MNQRRAATQRWQQTMPSVHCESGKRTYRTRHEAKRALRHIQSHRGGVNVKAAYRCSICDQWHLTHYRETFTPSPAAVPA